MKRVIAVVLIAALTTLMVGIDRTSWANQASDQTIRENQRAAVDRSLSEMRRGSTAQITRTDGTKIDVVIQEIGADSVTVMRQERDQVVTEIIMIADIARITNVSLRKMSLTSKVLIGVAVGFGVIVLAGLAACAGSGYGAPQPSAAEATP